MDAFSNLPHILFLAAVAVVLALMLVGEGDEENEQAAIRLTPARGAHAEEDQPFRAQAKTVA